MTENNQSEAPKKKLSLQELVKQQLENKKTNRHQVREAQKVILLRKK